MAIRPRTTVHRRVRRCLFFLTLRHISSLNRLQFRAMPHRTQLFADPAGQHVHDIILQSCHKHSERIALIDTSCSPARRITYAEYGGLVEQLARGLIAAGLRPGDIIGIFLFNSWEFAAAYHAATLAGAIPTPINPSYRERELRYQLENSGAVFLITDAPLLKDINLSGLPALRRVFNTRTSAPGAASFASLLLPLSDSFPSPTDDTRLSLAALPFSSGTTGLPKGVMLTHSNLVTNVYQTLTPNELGIHTGETVLCFLPLYHIYGLTVGLNCILTIGGTLVLMPRFDLEIALRHIVEFGVTMIPCVPPVLNAFSVAAEKGAFPRNHSVRWVKSGAAPLATELARRFQELTGIPIRQGYGMTEASPVTHIGLLELAWYRPTSIGIPVAQTDCRILSEDGVEVPAGELGELVMRGPQFMLGYWKNPQATDSVMRDGWYWSGDVARRDDDDFYFIVDRRKEMIKYKGFPVAPAEVEAVLMEHASVRDCGVVAMADDVAGEVPCAFVVLREGGPGSDKLKTELCGYVAERLVSYKQPRHVEFVATIPRNPSGKILRRELRKLL
jgi:long-chain acyl-CoA synthetase